MSWPVVVVADGPRERGRAYGERARDRIHASLEHAAAAEAYETIAAVAMDLTEGAIWITDGPPCTTAAERSDLPSLVARSG